jgi:16S rRNA G527 N7-methylase RsmG
MLVAPAAALGVDLLIYASDPNDSAAQICNHEIGSYKELSTIRKFAKKCDVITSRAFAELSDFVLWSGHLLASSGDLIALKGQAATEELGRLPEQWHITRRTAVKVPGMNAQRHLVHITRADQVSD